MWTYWRGEDKLVRVSLAVPPEVLTHESSETLQAITAHLGFPQLLDWSNRLDDGDEVLIFGPAEAGAAMPVPGRDDLQAESLAVWLRCGKLTGFFFAKTIADLAAVLSMIAAYEKALCEITEFGERFVEIRARSARDISNPSEMTRVRRSGPAMRVPIVPSVSKD